MDIENFMIISRRVTQKFLAEDLSSLKQNSKQIDLCTPSLGYIICIYLYLYIKGLYSADFISLDGPFTATVIVYVDNTVTGIKIGAGGWVFSLTVYSPTPTPSPQKIENFTY